MAQEIIHEIRSFKTYPGHKIRVEAQTYRVVYQYKAGPDVIMQFDTLAECNNRAQSIFKLMAQYSQLEIGRYNGPKGYYDVLLSIDGRKTNASIR